jgi:UDP-N-acetylmuramyl pentapeptide phosphotransferase/UDP-N-acetylglucosamine-1-phosphate transferase
MLYYLFDYLQETYNFPGAGVFQYISFRSAMAVITSLLVSMVFGGRIINLIRKKQIEEQVRELGLEGERQKKGTPTMGGLIIIAAILIPTLLFTKLENIYIIIMIISTLWMGVIGFIDDYIKVYRKDKQGLAGRFKILGQVGLGIIVGLIMVFHADIVVKEQLADTQIITETNISIANEYGFEQEAKQSTKTTIPFVKNNEFDYKILTNWMGDIAPIASMILFILIVILIITAVSNGANMTDGLDGLATGTSAIIGATIAVFAYVSGNIMAADYLNIMFAERTPRYSRALLETLSIIAYRQPVTRGDIEAIRGVSVSTSIMRTLTERNWVRIIGYRDVPGKPAMFATTPEFLDYFSLQRLDQLPDLPEKKEPLDLDLELDDRSVGNQDLSGNGSESVSVGADLDMEAPTIQD